MMTIKLNIKTEGFPNALDIDGAISNLEKHGIHVEGIISFQANDMIGKYCFSQLEVKAKNISDKEN